MYLVEIRLTREDEVIKGFQSENGQVGKNDSLKEVNK